jgi:hypothetical protein
VDALMNMVASKNAHVDPNDVPLSTLIEKNNDAIDVNFVSRNNFNNNAYRGNFNPRPFPENSSNNYGNSYGNYYNNNRIPSDLENHIKEFISSQKIFNTMIEEKLQKVDDLARNMDRIAHDVETLKIKTFPPKHDINESIKSIQVSINESKERTARLRAKREFLEKAIPHGFYRNHDEDIKMIGTTPIESLLSNIKLDEKGTGDESTLV